MHGCKLSDEHLTGKFGLPNQTINYSKAGVLMCHPAFETRSG